MSQKKTITVAIALWLVLSMFYYNIFSLLQLYTIRYTLIRTPVPQKGLPIYNNETDDFLISTPGCFIVNYAKTLHFKEATRQHFNCYDRIVFVEQTADHEIMFRIDRSKIKVAGNNFKCCYKFASRSTVPGHEDSRISFSQCQPFENGTKATLEEEVVTVLCALLSKNNKKILTYEDAYLILKKKPTDDLKIQTKANAIVVKENWNVLVVGMDTMSRARAYNSLPKTVKYLQDHRWLDYRAYHKVGFNTFPNVMSILTGKNASSAYKACGKGMDECKHSLLWNKFKEAGYITAFGEDNLVLPDTFSPYKGFKLPPTDHYTRPFFLTGEHRTGNYICTKSKPSAQHLLEYIDQFAQAYKNDSFFGYFWINSCSHNLEYLPTLFEDLLISFFDKLNDTGVLHNTFVFFVSDHGIRYGNMRVPRESYYEERLPMLFMWVPLEFREACPEEYYNLKLNQYRLTTPYDLHLTLWKLLKMTNRDVEIPPAEGCPQSEGLIDEVSLKRTCADACIDEKWCSCHNMTAAKNDTAASRSLQLAVKYIQTKALSVETQECTKCRALKLKTVLRNDWYKYNNKTYYIVAFVVSPGNVGYEANVEYYGDEFNILQPTETISAYNVRGSCVKNRYDRQYCVCETIKNCNKSVKKKGKG